MNEMKSWRTTEDLAEMLVTNVDKLVFGYGINTVIDGTDHYERYNTYESITDALLDYNKLLIDNIESKEYLKIELEAIYYYIQVGEYTYEAICEKIFN